MGGQHTMGIFTTHRQACPIPETGARLKRPLFRSVVNGNVDPDLRNVHISHHPCFPWIQKVVKLLPFLCGNQKLFTDLDKLEVGDRFTLDVLNETFTYEVDQILVTLPEETEELYVQNGKDLVTLYTCTPYGVNTHRLLVRGHRVTEPEE